jgi:hypothetical protein
MKYQAQLVVIVGSYVSSIDAKSDLEAFDALFVEDTVAAYDAAMVVNSAWGSATLGSRISRSSADFLDGPLHNAFTSLFGGPFMSGDAPIPEVDRRLPQETVRRLGDTFPAGSVVLIVVALARDSQALTRVLTHADWVNSQRLEGSEASQARLSEVLKNVLQRRRAEP